MPFTDDPPVAKRTGGTTPLVDQYLANFDKPTRAGALRWLYSTGSAADVAAKFTAEGFPLSEGAVRNWRIKNPAQVDA